MTTAAQRLAELGVSLPTPAAPVAAYVPYVITGNLVFVSGQLPLENGQVKYTGSVGTHGVDLATAKAAAQCCALNILAQVNVACGGNLERIERCVKLGAFVASAPDFYDHPQVVNGASEFLQQVLGPKGQHARFALGVTSLPRNATVEIDAVFEIK